MAGDAYEPQLVVHVYHAIDYARLWNTLAEGVPRVEELLAPYIEAAYAVPSERPESE